MKVRWEISFIHKSVRLDLRDIAQFLAPYPLKECKLWPKLTSHITAELCERVTPSSKKICAFSTCVLSIDSRDQRRRASAQQTINDIEVTHVPEHMINFTKVPRELPESPSPTEITLYSLDSSFFLEKLISEMPMGELI